jgi:hypothetical protein
MGDEKLGANWGKAREIVRSDLQTLQSPRQRNTHPRHLFMIKLRNVCGKRLHWAKEMGDKQIFKTSGASGPVNEPDCHAKRLRQNISE